MELVTKKGWGLAGTGFALALLGCGQTYRPVVSAVNPVGPASQPTKYAIAVANPGASNSGLMTIVDFGGDTVLATPQILTSPTYLTLLGNSAQAFALNAQNSLSVVPFTNPSTLLTSAVIQTTLPQPPANAPCTLSAATPCDPSLSSFLLSGTARVFVPETGRSAVAVLSTASPALQQEIGVTANPVYVVGVDSTPRAYVISNGDGTGIGQVAAIEGTSASTTSLGVSATLAVGIDPVYGVETTDARRAFILNHGSGTVSVVNVTNNAIDNANPTIPATGTLGTGPIWADLVTATNELVVLNQGTGTTAGSLSIINIPLCSSVAQPSNPSCNPLNPVDGVGFGQVVATVPVGINPQMVSVLADGSRAYVVNRGTGSCSNPLPTDLPGSVTVVNLASGRVSATIPAGCDPSSTVATTAASVYGHPNTVAATTGTPTGKVYLTSADSRFLTVLETDTDSTVAHVNLQGTGVRVLVTAP